MKTAHNLANGIDRIDLNILSALHGDARMSKVELGARVALSASRCYERMRRLERKGFIRGYHADIDLSRVANALQFLVHIKLLDYTSARAQQFERAILTIPEIMSCQGVLGPLDYMLVVAAASIEKYQEVIVALRVQGGGEFDFVTFPISKTIKAQADADLQQVVARLTVAKAG